MSCMICLNILHGTKNGRVTGDISSLACKHEHICDTIILRNIIKTLLEYLMSWEDLLRRIFDFSSNDFVEILKAAAPAGLLIYTILKDSKRYWQRRTEKEKEHKELFDKIFGTLNYSQFHPGDRHYNFPYEVHPDNMAACKRLIGTRLVDPSRRGVIITNGINQLDLERHVCSIGSTTSNSCARHLMDYSSDAPFKKLDEPQSEFPFEFVLDETQESVTRKLRFSFLDRREHTVPNWSIIETETERPFIPVVEGNCFVDDYLLMTVMPNVYNEKSLKKTHCTHVNFGGAHGPATESTAKSLSLDILKAIEKERKGEEYFQSLIHVKRVDHSWLGSKPGEVEHIKTVPLYFENFRPIHQ